MRQGDFAKPASLLRSFEGATQLLMISSNAAAHGGDPLAQHRAAIEAARATGVQRIVYTSHLAASRTSAFPPMLTHAATEDLLAQSGLAWTALRHGFYASSGVMFMGDVRETGVIEAPEDGKVSWTTHADLARAAAARILANEGCCDGPTPPLTGAQALDLADLAAIASELLGRSVERRIITDKALRAKMAARGLPSAVVEMTLGLYRASRAKEFAAVDPAVEKLLGPSPIPMRDLVAEKVGQP